jgi:hypothetical protein
MLTLSKSNGIRYLNLQISIQKPSQKPSQKSKNDHSVIGPKPNFQMEKPNSALESTMTGSKHQGRANLNVSGERYGELSPR